MAINKKDKTNSFEDLQSISGRDLGELAEKSITEDLFKGKQKRCKIATPSNKRSLRRNSQFKSSIIITPDWTSLDQFSPFYDPEEDTYKITVATNYETIGNQADKIYNEAKLIAANSIVEVYNKVAIKKDIEELVTSSSVLEYYVPIRPNPKCGPNGETIPLFGVKVLISIPGERVDKLKIAKNLIEQALPFANKEINLLSSEIKEKIKNTSSTIRSFYEDVVNSGNTVKGMSLDKEADRLEEFLFVLENLLSANGLFLREDRDDLIIIGVSDKDKVLYVLYDDGQEFSSLQAGLNLFLKTKSVSNEKTIRLLMEMGKLQGPGSGRPQYPVTDFLRNVVNQGGNVGLSLDQDIFDVVNRRAFAGDSVSPEEVSKELETYVQETNSRPIKTEEEKEQEDKFIATTRFIDGHASSDDSFLSTKTDFVGDATLSAPSLKKIKEHLHTLDDLYEGFFHRINLCRILQVAIDCLKVPDRACRIGKAWLISATCEDFLDFFSKSLAMRLTNIPELEILLRVKIMSCLSNLNSDERNFLLARIQFKTGYEVKSIIDLNKINLDAIIDALGSRGKKFLHEICDDSKVRKQIVDAIPDDICSALNTELSDIVKKCEFPTIKLPDFFPTIDIIAEISIAIEIAITDAILVALVELIKSIIDQILNCEDGFKSPNFGSLSPADLLAKTFDVNVDTDSFLSLQTNLMGDLALKAGVFGVEAGTTALAQAIAGFVDDVSSLVSPSELANLLNGNADDEVIALSNCLIETKHQSLKDSFNSSAKIEDLFKAFGNILDKSTLLDHIANLNRPEILQTDDLCELPEDMNFRNLLAKKGLTKEEIDKQVDASKKRKANMFDKLVNNLLSGNPLENALPPVFCKKDSQGRTEGLVRKDHPSFTFMLDKTIDTIYDGVYMTFNNEINGFIPSLKETSTIQTPRSVSRKITITVNSNGDSEETEVENPEFRRLISQGVSVEDPEDLDGDPVIVHEDLTYGTGFAANGLRQNLLNFQKKSVLFDVSAFGKISLIVPNSIDTNSLFAKTYNINDSAIAAISDEQVKNALRNLKAKKSQNIGVGSYYVDYKYPLVPKDNKDEFLLSISRKNLDGNSTILSEDIVVSKDIRSDIMNFIQSKGLQKDPISTNVIAARAGISTPLPQAYFGSYIAKIWLEGGTIYRNNISISKPDYARGVNNNSNTTNLINTLLRDEFKTNRYKDLFVDIFSSYALQVAKSPLFDLKVISLLDFTPDVKSDVLKHCTPHMLDLNKIKDKMKKAMEEAACTEDLFPASKGLGKSNLNSMEKEGVHGAIRTFIRLIVIENILRSIFVFSEFRIDNFEEIDNAIIAFISDRIMRDLANVGEITKDLVFTNQFIEQTISFYNQLVDNGEINLEKTKTFSVAADFFVKQELRSVIEFILKLFKRKGSNNNHINLDNILVENYLPLFDAQSVPILENGKLEFGVRLAKSNSKKFRATDQELQGIFGHIETFAANIDESKAFSGNITNFNLENGNLILERYVRVRYKNEQERINIRFNDINSRSQIFGNVRDPFERDRIRQYVLGKEFGVLSLSDFNKLLNDIIKPELESMNRSRLPDWTGTTPEHLTYDLNDIFEDICYGLRLVYVPPLSKDFGNITPADDVMNQILSPIGNSKYKDAIGFDKSYGVIESHDEETKNLILNNEGKFIAGDITQTSSKKRIIHEFPLFSVEVNENLNIIYSKMNNNTYDVVDNWNSKSLTLKNDLISSEDFKFLFHYCIPVDRMLTLLTIYNIVYLSSLPKVINLFNGTKIAIKSVFQALLNSGNYRYKDQYNDQMGGNIGLNTNALNNENTNPDIPGTSVAAMAARTPYLILKGLVELIDPNIHIARKIVDAAKTTGNNIPIIGASMGLLPVNVFPPPPIGPGIGPPISPLGFVYLALNIDEIFDSAQGKDTKRESLGATLGIDLNGVKNDQCADEPDNKDE